MAAIAIKRAYDPPSSQDGRRILIDRLWPRGLRKDDLALDFWAKDIAPSTELRQWFDHRPDRFVEFKRRYLAELKHNPAVADLRARIGQAKATLVYAAKDPAINHAVVLAEFLMLPKTTGRRTPNGAASASRSRSENGPPKAPRRHRTH
jgi:uncharacterized protein YeaO (DUF488 family)